FPFCHSREYGNLGKSELDSRLRGNDRLVFPILIPYTYTVMKYIDIHSHLGFEDLPAQAGGAGIKEVIERMQNEGVATIAVGADLASSKEAVKFANENENVWACIGMHPAHNLEEVFDDKEYEELVKNPKVVAIGECGLDYYIDKKSKIKDQKSEEITEEEKERQKKDFIKQIEFSIKYKKPLMLHIREAHNDAYEILKKYEGKAFGNLHFFTSNLNNAKRFTDLGFTISFPGIITYPPKKELGRTGVSDLDDVIKNIPLEKIHAETDSPYAAPVPHRGERNEPAYVIEVYKKIAEIRGEDFEKVRLQLLENAKKLFGI
ncbi:MAG: TatD family hydrolase, partial [Candidatus Taylorbacteria bacterium]|nr:TatD family hydrolase [Candidatus Taylorbacteria bacterium]